MKKLLLMLAATLSLSACTGNAEGDATAVDSTATATEEVTEAPADPLAIPVLKGEDGAKDAQAVIDYLKANLDACKDLKEAMELDKTMKFDSLCNVMEEFVKANKDYEAAATEVFKANNPEQIMEAKMKELMSKKGE